MAAGDYWDIDTWRLYKGIRPEDMFDLNTGQPINGWRRTARGYENDAYPDGPMGVPSGGPVTTGTPSLGGGALGSLAGNAPVYNTPGYLDIGQFDPGPAFTYKDFTAPDPSKVAEDPSFQFRFDQGVKALSAQKAGQGTFLSGATGKALQDYGQNAASQEYNNIWNRSLSEYDTNRNNAFGNWASQYGQRKDVYGFNQQNANAHNQFNLTNAQNDWNSLFQSWAKNGDWMNSYLTTLANQPY